MGDLSTNFSRIEFACRCGTGCGKDTVDAELLSALQEIRDELGPVHILSGHRCERHNQAVGGAPRSMHLEGKAADFVVRDLLTVKTGIWVLNKYSGKYGIGLYSGWVHLDVRRDEARW